MADTVQKENIMDLDLLWTDFILAEFLGIPLAAWLWKKGSGWIQGGKHSF